MVPNTKPLVDMSVSELSALIETKTHRVEQLEEALSNATPASPYQLSESMADLQLAVDDFGWKPLGGPTTGADGQISLDTIKKMSDTCRSLVTANPLVKRAVAIRSGYIWGHGVEMIPHGNTRGRPTTNVELPDSVRSAVGTTTSQLEIERTIAADGNLFFLVDTRNRSIQRIPLSQISGKLTEGGNPENILYFQRTWNDEEIDLTTGVPEGPPQNQVWHPSSTLQGRHRTAPIMNVRVDPSKRIVHVPFNRLAGQSWGVPDIFPVMWWVRAYVEYLSDCRTLTKAHAQFAWKVTSASGKGQSRVASQMAAPPQRDPATGQSLAIGGAAVLGAGQDLQAISRNTSVDFNAGKPLAALIAAGMEVPLPALTADPSDGNRATAETLDDPTILAMLARQRIMDDALLDIFRQIHMRIEIRWPEIAPEAMHRHVQAVDMATRSGAFSGEEQRAMFKVALGDRWKHLDASVPSFEDLPITVQRDVEPPAQVDPPSRGDHFLRDQGDQAHTEEG